ncbi:hypothetical protein [uncultured Lacinutrix sp.]|uniref:hypothetical protein n=1 Tax=uncultured Lacinutrix sp. TaxID=574032 RepID=UPI0026388BD4|nr:hypothetical protein [uncultured Lacinutrix sp.]
MKYLNNINLFIIITTAILYLTVILGLYAQVVLGVTQVLTSLILIFYWKSTSKKNKNKLFNYWSFVVIYWIGWLIPWPNSLENTFGFVIGLIIIPLSISVYFITLLDSVTKEYYLEKKSELLLNI